MYGGGHAEELVDKAIKDFKRGNIFIITKSLAKPHKV
jgi:aryl-alcohol dehydrogenase-like predicted oxidoreductase